ncbi:serine/threonine protein kinase [Saccharomycopsis crataegensis]|uniref:non-specific serine/threonine protein kinase n=1 Tax=Saccharomycopsis crataegensis TaxID=43959 RepID=A0AAV5QFE1_9ASCO|nr:serine/threonine protein kinase [Saccharomycopsis crataegensis]
MMLTTSDCFEVDLNQTPKTPTKSRIPPAHHHNKHHHNEYQVSPSSTIKSAKRRKPLNEQDFGSIKRFLKVPSRSKVSKPSSSRKSPSKTNSPSPQKKLVLKIRLRNTNSKKPSSSKKTSPLKSGTYQDNSSPSKGRRTAAHGPSVDIQSKERREITVNPSQKPPDDDGIIQTANLSIKPDSKSATTGNINNYVSPVVNKNEQSRGDTKKDDVEYVSSYRNLSKITGYTEPTFGIQDVIPKEETKLRRSKTDNQQVETKISSNTLKVQPSQEDQAQQSPNHTNLPVQKLQELQTEPVQEQLAQNRKPLQENSKSKQEECEMALRIEDEEIMELQNKFHVISRRYKVLEKIGEGTFSSVYKAEDLVGISNKVIKIHRSKHDITSRKKFPLVALKKIYVTSSPQRIYSELKFLYNLSGCRNIIPIVDAVRFEDQIVIVLPYCEHADYRDYYRDLPFNGIKIYMYELLSALSFIHDRGVIHRDVKPNNFLFNPATRRGVLVDFGLAEKVRDPHEHKYTCACISGGLSLSDYTDNEGKGYPKDDDRPARRANRAGTRGFRAPEVLLKCPNQTTKIDIWSAGVILLSLLARRFPFFDSNDDVDALVELTTIFGVHLMKHCAALHGLGFETNLPTLNDNSRSLSEIVFYALNIEKEANTFPEDSVAFDTLNCLSDDGSVDDSEMGVKHKVGFHLLKCLMELNYSKRYSADEALSHKFFEEFGREGRDEKGDDISYQEIDDVAET